MKDAVGIAARLWCLPQHVQKIMDVDLAQSIAAALADAYRKGQEDAYKDASMQMKLRRDDALDITHHAIFSGLYELFNTKFQELILNAKEEINER